MTYRGIDSGGTTLKPDHPSVFWDETCSLYMTVRSTAGSSGSFSLSNEYLSPDDQIVATSNPTYTSNISCRLLNANPVMGGSSLTDMYESSVNTTHSADTIHTWLETLFDCDFDAGELFIYNGTSLLDSYGNHPYGYGKKFGTCFEQSPSSCSNDLTGDLGDVINYMTVGYYTDCGADLRTDAPGEEYHTGSCGGVVSDVDMNYWIMVPFNSMASGHVNISVFGRFGQKYNPAIGGTLAYANQYYLWDTVANTTINLGTSYPLNYETILIPDREYWLFIGTRYSMSGYNCGSGQNWGVVHNYTDYNVSIWAYEPAWECGSWSDCEGNVESRVCVDPEGKAYDMIEYRTCAVGIIENATLGFEDYTTVTATVCNGMYSIVPVNYGTFSGYSCDHYPYNISTSRPVNWTVWGDSLYFNRYFMDFTSEWATEGSRSLKMWTIPPKEAEVSWSGSAVYCTNVTDTNYPIVETSFSNTTMSVYFNVTFPATNMRLSFDANKCDRLVQQHGQLDIINVTWGSVPLIQLTACPEFCYGSSCDNEPTGQFYYDLVDNDSNSLFGTTQWIDLDAIQESGRKITVEYDLSNSGIEPGRSYNLSFAVFPRNYLDTNGNCIMLDNVRYDVLELPMTSVMSDKNGDGDVCDSQCVGDDWYEARRLSSGECLVKRIEFSDTCTPDAYSDYIANNTDFCTSSTVLRHFNTFIDDYEEFTCDYGCEDGHCLTEEEYNAAQEQLAIQYGLYDPIPLVVDLVGSWLIVCTEYENASEIMTAQLCTDSTNIGYTFEEWDLYGYDWLWYLLSKSAMYSIGILFLILVSILGIYISSSKGSRGDIIISNYPWQLTLILWAGALLIGVPLQFVSWEIGLTIATMIGLVLAYEIRKGSTG